MINLNLFLILLQQPTMQCLVMNMRWVLIIHEYKLICSFDSNKYGHANSGLEFIMEFIIGGRKRAPHPIFRLCKQRGSQKLQDTNLSSNGSPLGLSLNNSLLYMQPDIESTILDEKTKAKASMLLSTPISPSQSKKRLTKRQSQISLMYNPRKRITITDLTPAMKRRKKIGVSKFALQSKIKVKQILGEHQQAEVSGGTEMVKEEFEEKLASFGCFKQNPANFFPIADYFQLVFCKILSKPSKQKLYILVQDLAKRYQKYPETIPQDVQDIRKIACKLKLALDSKQGYVELRPFEALEVNGELARLIFHLAHEITARKYKNYDLDKIYKQIEYCSRKLQFHNFTLKVCFQLGEIYKQKKDELNSHTYFAKALKLSIFLNDKFHQEKAIDCFGLTAYLSNRSGQAHYFHQNSTKLNIQERQNIQQKYSNLEELTKISTERDQACQNRAQMSSTSRFHSRDRRKETFNFSGQEYSEIYDIENRRKFKQNIKNYIQCPVMRSHILVAKDHINKIEKIGQIQRYKNFQITKPPQKFAEDLESSSQIMLTHYSLNRRNPEMQRRAIEKDRKILLEVIGYFTSELIGPVRHN